VVSAAVVALTVELADLALDRMGLSGRKYRTARKLLRAALRSAVAGACGALLSRAADQPDAAAANPEP